MRTKTLIKTAFVTVFSVALVFLAIYSAQEYLRFKEMEAQGKLLQQKLQEADSIADDRAAVAAYGKLSPMLPEIQLRIVQRQWRMVMELMHYMQRSRDNAELQDGKDVYGGRLKSLLDQMIERCSKNLADGETASPEIQWQFYNALGSAKVMSAFVILETDQNADKVQGIIRDALTDFKSAIEVVDKSGAPASLRNIPRWNFEVLSGKDNVKKFEVSMTDMEKNQTLKEDLETLLPDIGGYGPGEPMETIIKK